MFTHYLTCLFLFRTVVLTEKYKSVKAVEDDFYQEVIEAKCSGNFKLKAGYILLKSRQYGAFLRTRIIALKILSTKSTVKKRKKSHVQSIFLSCF